MAVPEPRDRKAFERWLASKPSSWSVVIAARAALRVLPLIVADKISARTAETFILPLFRAAAIARFAAVCPNRAIGAAADAAAARVVNAAAYAAAAAAATADTPDDDAPAAAARAVFAAVRADLADRAARVAKVNADTASASKFAAAYAAAEAAAAAARVSAAAAAIRNDLSGLQDERWTPQQLGRTELWPIGVADRPPKAAKSWSRLATLLHLLGNNWQVWVTWYDGVLAGSPPAPQRSQEWEMAFTDVGEPLPWDDLAAAVNMEIAARLARLTEGGTVPTAPTAPVLRGPAGRERPTSNLSRSPPRTRIGKAVLQNKAAIALSIEPLLLLIDQKIAALDEERPNSDDATAKLFKSIAEYQGLKAQIEELQVASLKFAGGNAEEQVVIAKTKSFADGVSAWWTKHYDEICSSTFSTGLRTFEASLFVGCISICALAGVGGSLTTALTAALIGGKPIIGVLKSLPKIFSKN